MSKFPHRLADFHISSVKCGTSWHYTRKIWNRCQNLFYFSIIMTLRAVQQHILCFLNCQTFLNWLSASRLENLCRKTEPDVIAVLCSVHPACSTGGSSNVPKLGVGLIHSSPRAADANIVILATFFCSVSFRCLVLLMRVVTWMHRDVKS